MKGKWPLSFVLILLVACSAWAQDEGETEIMRNLMNSIARTGLSDAVPYYSVSNREEAKVEGSVLLDQEWKEGRVLKANGELYRIVGRYNTQADEIQIKVGDDIRAIYPDRVRAASLGNQIFVPKAFEAEEHGLKLGFFELLVEGEASLLKRYSPTTRKTDYHPVLGSTSDNVEIVIHEEYYYQLAGKQAEKLKRTRSGVLEALRRKRNAVNEYARDNHVGWKKEDDLKLLFAKHNELVVQSEERARVREEEDQ